jgi:hypothetical protein
MEEYIMANEFKDQLNDGFEKAKSVGTSRFSAIRSILSETLPKLWAEILAGAKELGGIGGELASDAGNTVKHKVQTEGYVKAEILRKEASKWIQNLAEQTKTIWRDRSATFKTQASKIDTDLEARYGDKYQTAKQRVDQFLAFYKSQQAQVATGESTGAIEVPYQIVEEKAAQVGATLAQKEAQMKQKVQDAVAAVLNS